MVTGIALIAMSVAVILWCIAALHGRQQIQRARARGLWPPPGQFPTAADVQRLAQAGETVLAIRLYRQVCGGSLREAMEAVYSLAPQRRPRLPPSRCARLRASPPCRLLIPTAVGLVIGVLFVLPVTFGAIPWGLDLLNTPAGLLFEAWDQAGFGPHGDQGWEVLRIMIVLQWLLLGLCTGVAWLYLGGPRARPTA